MYALGNILKYRETDGGTDILLTVPHEKLGKPIREKHIMLAEIRLDDGRSISVEQRKKAYATIRDIAEWTGYSPEETKEVLKIVHIIKTGSEDFSLSDCSMDTAREFINTMLDFALENGVPLTDSGLDRTDDIGRYLYACLQNRRCCICGKPADIHHVKAVGMGANRNKIDDSQMPKMALCRTHHTESHAMGQIEFCKKYHVFGIIFNKDGEDQCDMQYTQEGTAPTAEGILYAAV